MTIKEAVSLKIRLIILDRGDSSWSLSGSET